MIEKLYIPEPYMAELVAMADTYGLKTPLRIAHFYAQARHESQNFTHVEENLNYGAPALLSIFGNHFNHDMNIAQAYSRQPEKIANRIYADRMGNGNEASGDGWKYRGRGIFQLTGRYMYSIFGTSIKEDIITAPDLLMRPSYAVKSALWFWVKNYLNDIADKGSDESVVAEIRKHINGGQIGLPECVQYFNDAMKCLQS